VAVGPRLYITVDEAAAIPTAATGGQVLHVVAESAVEASTLPMRARWIAPVEDDPTTRTSTTAMG
jgi:hypothetical protein